MGEDRPMEEGHLETNGHGEAAKTVEWCGSDQILHLWSAIDKWSSSSDQMGRGAHRDLRR